MKKLFACVLMFCIICTAFVLPTFAYVDSADNPSTTFNDDGRALATLTTSEINRYSARNILTAIDKAYALGLFGGACPVAVRISGGFVKVYCLPPSSAIGLPRDGGAFVVAVEGGTNAWEFHTVNSSNQEVRVSLSTFVMTYEGSFTVEGTANSTSYSGLLARRDIGEWDTSGWDTPGWTSMSSGTSTSSWITSVNQTYTRWLESPPSTEEAFDNGYAAGLENGFQAGRIEGESVGYENGYDDGVLQGYQTGYAQGDREGYERGYDEGYLNGSPNTLNIPSIFDAMFDGVQSIFRSVDIEIFGISILGTLVAFLVIAIVTYTIKRLTK